MIIAWSKRDNFLKLDFIALYKNALPMALKLPTVNFAKIYSGSGSLLCKSCVLTNLVVKELTCIWRRGPASCSVSLGISLDWKEGKENGNNFYCSYIPKILHYSSATTRHNLIDKAWMKQTKAYIAFWIVFYDSLLGQSLKERIPIQWYWDNDKIQWTHKNISMKFYSIARTLLQTNKKPSGYYCVTEFTKLMATGEEFSPKYVF